MISPAEYEFEWELEITFNRAMDILKSVSFRIAHIQFNESTTKQTKQTIQQLFQNYLVHQINTNTNTNTNANPSNPNPNNSNNISTAPI